MNARDASAVYDALHQAGIIQQDPSTVRRVVIDLQAGNIPIVYVELFADTEKLAVVLGASLTVSTTPALALTRDNP